MNTQLTNQEPSSQRDSGFKDLIDQFRPELGPYEDLYKRIHQDPEFSLQENTTAELAAAHLEDCGFTVRKGVGGHGVVGFLDNGQGKTVLLRSELDALPVLEQTKLPYASTKRMKDTDGKEKPVMHACGHDMHLVSLLGAAHLLQASRDRWSGRLLIILQPNEERGGGARAMVEDGLYGPDGVPRPDIVLGQHILKHKAGVLKVGPGSVLAGKRSFQVSVEGRGGHASDPQDCIDPVVTACHIVIRLQSIVSREIDPSETIVITCGTIQAGDSPNIIPDKAILTVDIRALSPDVLDAATQSVKRIIKAECVASGIEKEPEIQEIENVPPLINSSEAARVLERWFKATFGDTMVQPQKPNMASDDFSILAPEGVPYVYWTLGSTDPELWVRYDKENRLHELPGNHSPFFCPAIQPTLKAAVDALSVATLVFFRL